MYQRPPPTPSIRGRLVQSLLWTSVVVGVLTSVIVWHVISHEMGELMDQELHEAAEIFHSAMSYSPRDGLAAQPGPAVPASRYEDHLVWQVVDSGAALVVSRSHKAPPQALVTMPTREPTWTGDGRWRVHASAFSQHPGRLLVVAQGRAKRDEAHQEVAFYALGAALSMSLLSALLMNWRVQQELRPLGALSQSVQAYDPLGSGAAPRATPRRELLPIEQSVADLGTRLAQRVIRERAFTAHAAHALRTPVAGIDVQLALAIREAPDALRPRLERARSAAHRLGRVMQALLMLFRSGAEPQRQPIKLQHLVDELGFPGLAIAVQQDTPVAADPDLLAAALWNLLDNSQRFRARRVTVSARHDGAHTVLQLQDDGEGCTPETRASLVQSLQQQTYGEGGAPHGLGLVLADLVARAHGGHATLPHSLQGFCVELRWPSKA